LAYYGIPEEYDWRAVTFQRNMIGVLWHSRRIWLACYDIPEEYDWLVMTFQRNTANFIFQSFKMQFAMSAVKVIFSQLAS